MDFAHYSQRAAALVNADLSSEATLRDHLPERPWLLDRLSGADLVSLRAVQIDLAGLVDASAAGDGPDVVHRLNDLLSKHPIRPRVSGHDESSWHLHVNDDDASVADTMISEALLGLAILVTEVGATRLGRCAAESCTNAFVDTSANHSRRFCSARCSTRTNVAALRRRKQQQMRSDPSPAS
ncbi:MAG TPA: CGNR zinc finger domain-containing protein [Kineosporiaceae bacterium]|nr:CGNR zinc finger domain-containing protein [Kineosporiaceae bacterium]